MKQWCFLLVIFSIANIHTSLYNETEREKERGFYYETRKVGTFVYRLRNI